MRRRKFITLLGGAAAAWPHAARAQQAAMPVIGLLGASSADLSAGPLRAIRQGLEETGYVEARNLAIEYRWAEGKNDRLPGLASDLVRRQVSVIVVPLSTPGALVAKSATTSIPVVFQVGSDPVAIGLVASLNRPGGNLTGVAVLNAGLGPKRLELLRELVPTATVIGCLLNPTSPVLAEATSRELEVAARSFGELRLHVLHASSERDFDAVFATLVQLRAGGLVIGPDALFTSRSAQLAALALRHAVPTVYQFHRRRRPNELWN
jgi:putative ABC transport system substrate-binding protein